MFGVWQAFFCMISFSVVVFIPFATFYYESEAFDMKDPTKRKSRLLPALCQGSVVLVFFLTTLLALYFTKSYAIIPIEEHVPRYSEIFNYSRSFDDSPFNFLDMVIREPETVSTSSTVDVIMPVDFAVFAIGLFSWLGWWMFAIFAGVGLSSTPFDLIVAYVWRPRVLAPDVLANKELELQEKTADLLEITSLLKRDRANLNDGSSASKRAMRLRYLNDRMEVNKLTQMVFILERDVEEFKSCKVARKGYNPLWPFVNLYVGIFFAFISLLWLLQVILAILSNPPASPFLSLYLNQFDLWFPMFGNLTYALFSLYLLLCTIKGCFKLSVRFVCCKLHPMQVGGTYLNAFLFNLGIVMTCTVPLVHFCVIAFDGYTVNSDVFFMFAVQVNNLNFFNSFFRNKVFIWIMMLVAFALLPYLAYRPRDVAISTEDFRRTLHERSAQDYAALGTRDKSKGASVELTKV